MYCDLEQVNRHKAIADSHLRLLAEFIWILKGHSYAERRRDAPTTEVLDASFMTEDNVVVWAAIRKLNGETMLHQHRLHLTDNPHNDGSHVHAILPLFMQADSLQKVTLSERDVKRAYDDLHDFQGLRVSTSPLFLNVAVPA